ncbi:CocE/NonD family hydrolase [Schlesneria paludicola]|uniref:CocE/NonD family hydrolase n=1 Tax=Schlesneria paludicola TaxID=360056 RepID=UPI00029A75EC|nr:CocE/NonD family hydrolase [Schlesneria paludicola]
MHERLRHSSQLNLAVVVISAVWWGLFSQAASAQGIEFVKANYTKSEFRIPMRDGKQLFTAVYAPKDQSKTYPILLTRTPYGIKPYGVDQYRGDLGPSALFGKSGYLFVYQDVRGRFLSEGDFVNVRPQRDQQRETRDTDESTDTWDTIEWLMKHCPGHNGKVGMTGVSYPGFYTNAGMIDAHPALVACSPQAPVVDWFIGDDWHHNGAFHLAEAVGFINSVGLPRGEPTTKSPPKFDPETPDGYEFLLALGTLTRIGERCEKSQVPYWKELMAHGTYDGYWKTRDLRPHLRGIRPAVMTVGGWFDAENLFGALETYRQIEGHSPEAKNILVMGPWSHGAWSRSDGDQLGAVSFNSKTGQFFREQIELPFFEYHLKGQGTLEHPEAWVFETGTNVWKKYDTWPPKSAEPRTFYLHSKGRISGDMPTENESKLAFDEYLSNPAKPVPYTDKTTMGMTADYMTADQRHAARRPDVLVYQSDTIERDTVLSGPVEVEFYVSTTGTDSDWIVKLIDVYPNDYPDPKENPTGIRMGGYQQLIRGDILRGKFRNGFDRPEPFTPGKAELVKFKLADICHVFRPGHRLMIQIQSTWFPLFDRNPQTFVDIYAASPDDFQAAVQRVYRSYLMPSCIRVLQQP